MGVFLAHVDTVSFDFCRAFLVGQLSGANIEKLLDDDGFYKKTHQHENMDMSLIKIPPAVTVFMSNEGFFEVAHGLFVTCKTAEVEEFKSLKQKTTTKKTTKAGNAKKRNKYLVSRIRMLTMTAIMRRKRRERPSTFELV